MKIEPVEYKDFVKVMSLLKNSHAESRYSNDPINCDVAIMRLEKSIDEPETNLAFKCVMDDDIVGIYIAYISSFDFSLTPTGFEWTFYVTPTARGTKAASMLKQSVLDWMAERHMRFISAIHHQEDNSKTYEFCEKMGMREVGRIYERMM